MNIYEIDYSRLDDLTYMPEYTFKNHRNEVQYIVNSHTEYFLGCKKEVHEVEYHNENDKKHYHVEHFNYKEK